MFCRRQRLGERTAILVNLHTLIQRMSISPVVYLLASLNISLRLPDDVPIRNFMCFYQSSVDDSSSDAIKMVAQI